jgi:GT2 family glycosyltransferase
MVTWNSMPRLTDALASLSAQTFRDLSVIAVDNGSSDGTVDEIRARMPEAMVLRNSRNLVPARARNQAIAHAAAHLRSDGDLFVLTMSPDMVLEPDYLETLVGQLERRPEVGSAGGKVCRMRAVGEETLATGEKTDVIEAAGLGLRRSRARYERGRGERDDGSRYVRSEEVFGFPDSLALYRLQALESVATGAEFFDEDFFGAEEDADLAWRLRIAGWQSLYVSAARAYRYADGSARGSATDAFLSYRNRLLRRLKSDRVGDFLLGLPWIAAFELREFAAALFLRPRSLRAIPAALALVPRTLRKRGAVMKTARAKGGELRKWFK